MSKVKSRSKCEKTVELDEQMNSSDDDYIDPKMEKYFKDAKDKIQEKLGLNGKHHKKSMISQNDEDDNDDFEDISDFEQEEEEDEEMDDEEQSEDQDEDGELSADEKNEEIEEIDVDQRKKLTLKTINNWSRKLGVKNILFI